MILITGATGREIVKQLSVAGAQVRALVRHPEKASALKGPGVELVTGDLDQPETLDAALNGVACALLLPANTPCQVEQERHFIEAAKRVHTPHVLKYSAFGAHVSSTARISQWHGQSEQYLEESGVPFTHVRPYFFMQNMLWFASAIATQGAFYLPMQDAAVSMVDTRDIAAVVTIVLTTPGHAGKIYTITGPEAFFTRSRRNCRRPSGSRSGMAMSPRNTSRGRWSKGDNQSGMRMRSMSSSKASVRANMRS
jgi:uncharacterized protein YbjT (DUF2867 family)